MPAKENHNKTLGSAQNLRSVVFLEPAIFLYGLITFKIGLTSKLANHTHKQKNLNYCYN